MTTLIEAALQALEALETCMYPQQKQIQALTSLRQAIEQAEEKNCKNCVIDKPCIAKGKDMQICGAFVSKHAKELKQIALEKKAENARELGLDYEPVQAEKQEHEFVCGECVKCGASIEKREWVALTDEELKPLCDVNHIIFGAYTVDFVRSIEAKLKEKNT